MYFNQASLDNRCHNKEVCEFDFSDLPTLECKIFDSDIEMGIFFPVKNLLYLNISYACLSPRIRCMYFNFLMLK